jgi:FkbM family methyltransferase
MSMRLKQILLETSFFIKTAVRRSDVKFKIGNYQARLPRGHRLPLLRKLYPGYDLYFVEFFRELNNVFRSGTLIDIGANIGDTTLEVLSAAPNFSSIAVEGSDGFISYLQTNTQIISNRVQLVTQFLYSTRIESLNYNSDLTTGGFSEFRSDTGNPHNFMGEFISADELLAMELGDVVVWKSDTDGLDVPILLENWPQICATVDVIWIELHPNLPPTSLPDIKKLSTLLLESKFQGVLFDNYGCVVGSGRERSLGDLVFNNCEKMATKSRRLQRSPYYFDLIVFKSSIGSMQTIERLMDTLNPAKLGRLD